jgi:hypothetical protein
MFAQLTGARLPAVVVLQESGTAFHRPGSRGTLEYWEEDFPGLKG